MWTREAAEAIKTSCVSHYNFECTYALLEEMIFCSSEGELIAVTGPSRIGKTRTVREVLTQMFGALKDPDDFMPWMYVTAKNCSVRGEFSTKTFTVRALTAVRHPIYGLSPRESIHDVPFTRNHNIVEGELQEALLCALQCRRVKVVVFDEAQHILHSARGFKDACAILDSWKCLAADAGVILVVVGAYELLTMLETSAHMIGRSSVIHMPRYGNNAADVQAFEQALRGFNQILATFQPRLDLSPWNQQLFDECLGSVGLLNKALRSALACAGARKASTLKWEHFRAAERPAALKNKLLSDIKAGERLLASTKCDVSSPPKTKPRTNKQTPKAKPFERKPTRDPVGA